MDWCNSKWDVDGIQKQYPCRILMFIDTMNMKFGSPIVNTLGRYLAIIRSTKDDSRSTTSRINSTCKLIESFEIEQSIRIIDCDTITKPIFVVPDVIKVKKEFNVKAYHSTHILKMVDYQNWSNFFIENEWI